MKQITISERLKVHRSEICRITNGRRRPSWRLAVLLSREFGRSPEWWRGADPKAINRELRRAA